MKLSELLAYIRAIAPEESAMDGDPIGLLIEPASSTVSSVVVCLDATADVVKAAIGSSAELVIAHHPLIYHPLRKLERQDPIASASMDLVRAGIGLYAAHTNWDLAPGGVNDTLANTLGLTDVVSLPNQPIARIGKLILPLSPSNMIAHVGASLNCTGTNTLRHTPVKYAKPNIKTVAVCGGAGGSLLADAISAGADAFVTSDVRHDVFIDAAARGILLIDAGHDATESPGMEALAGLVQDRFPELSVKFCLHWL